MTREELVIEAWRTFPEKELWRQREKFILDHEKPTSTPIGKGVTGVGLIASERQRQIEAEGYSSWHDDQHVRNDLVAAAYCYMYGENTCWPWNPSYWKPTDRIRNLTKAGALIAAEIDRLLRASKNQVQ